MQDYTINYTELEEIEELMQAYETYWKQQKEDAKMKGYYNNSGYMGYVGNGWVLFACESDYMEYLED